MGSQRTNRGTHTDQGFCHLKSKWVGFWFQVMQNGAFVQHKGVGQGMFFKADDTFAEHLDHGLGKVTGLPWCLLAAIQATMIQSPKDFFRI